MFETLQNMSVSQGQISFFLFKHKCDKVKLVDHINTAAQPPALSVLRGYERLFNVVLACVN